VKLFNTILAVAAVLLVGAVTASVALADGQIVGPKHVLQVEAGSSDTIVKWQSGADSRYDSNQRRLHSVVPAGSYFAVYTQASLNLNRPLVDVENLSFEFSENSHVGAGAPRISVELDNGATLFLSANYCNHPTPTIVGSGPSGGTPVWGRSDFTRYTTNCSIFDSAGTEYAADGTHTALKVYEASHPDVDALRSYVVGDEEGRYNLDRISLGTHRMYVRSFHSAVRCPSEGSC
jgi:hypothetical protein